MKHSFLLAFLFSSLLIHAQTKAQWALYHNGQSCRGSDTVLYKNNYKDKYSNYDYSKIWTTTENIDILGFAGSNYQRLQMKFLSVKKDSLNPDTYIVIGKSKIRDNICSFTGRITITNIKRYKQIEFSGYNLKGEGILFGNYSFHEDSSQNKSGVFEGSFASCWSLNNKYEILYDSLKENCDGWCNNQFAGTWQSYTTKVKETCNWGDYRMPFSGDFDFGCGEFTVNEKYRNNGWESFPGIDATEAKWKKARNDSEKWWK